MSEAQLAQKDYAGAQRTLEPFSKSLLPATNQWQWQQLLCRIDVAAGHLPEALQKVTNLVNTASNTAQISLQAESFAFEADILERLGRKDEAIKAYNNNLIEGVPVIRQREALFKIAELSIAQNRTPEAAATSKGF